MKLYRIIPAAVLPLALLAAADAYASPFDQYVSVKGTVSRMHNTIDAAADIADEYEFGASATGNKTIGGATIAYGLDFAKNGLNVRGEIELGLSGKAKYSENFGDEDSSGSFRASFQKTSFLINGYYDFRNSTKFTPYIGAGIGLARVKASLGLGYADSEGSFSLSQSKSKVNFVYQVGAGASYEASENISLDLGYRFVDYGSVKQHAGYIPGVLETSTKVKAREHQFYAGVRYTFK
jgi:opacity protein-like surface antigen